MPALGPKTISVKSFLINIKKKGHKPVNRDFKTEFQGP